MKDLKYTRSSKNYARTDKERLQLYYDTKMYYEQELLDEHTRVKHVGACLLDSSLIIKYNLQLYRYKIIQCGSYYQLYDFRTYKSRVNKNLDKIKIENNKKNRKMFSILNNKENENIDINFKSRDGPIKKNKDRKIEIKNIQRSKMELERLVKSNEDIFKTFITLTFKENIVDIKESNKIFNYWISNIRKLKKDFAYVCVPELQKKREKKTGFAVVHYHLLTNLDIKQNPDIIIPQKKFSEKQYLEMTEKQRRKCFDVKYWPHGFTSVYSVKDVDVVGYMSKYMTKDIDNRFFGHRRYLYSRKLVKPSVSYLDFNSDNEFYNLLDIINTCDVCYKNTYSDKFGNNIDFIEYKARS